jgi:hypothetical protein
MPRAISAYLRVPADPAGDVVLRLEVHADAELLCDEAEDRLGLVEPAGHDQVAEDEPAPGQAVLVAPGRRHPSGRCCNS